MIEEILININPFETRVAVMSQNIVEEIHIERNAYRGYVGNIYLGRVLRVLPGMQAAFIDIGLERAAFLHANGLWRDHAETLSFLPPTIESIIYEGQTIMVQVTKDPIGEKGARLSTSISIVGRTLVFIPSSKQHSFYNWNDLPENENTPPLINISQKICSEVGRERIKRRLEKVLFNYNNQGNYIIRTLAEDASIETLTADVEYLNKTWETVKSRAKKTNGKVLLYRDLDLSERVLRDIVSNETCSIKIDDRLQYIRLVNFTNSMIPGVSSRLKLYESKRPLFESYGIEEEINKALSRRVDLKSGGHLIIEQTEAMTTIDVNTGGFVGTKNFIDTIYKTNLEAAQSIARQLRIRNIGGIIVIDFIDMDNKEHREHVLSTFKKALSLDRSRINVGDFSSFGLVELTRKRTRESLSHLMCGPCPTCETKKEIKTPRTLCYEILRKIKSESEEYDPTEFCIVAAESVIDAFLDDESMHLAAISDQVGKPISLRIDRTFRPEQYHIIVN